MSMNKKVSMRVIAQIVSVFLGTLFCATFLAQPANSQQQTSHDAPVSTIVDPSAFTHSEKSDEKSAAASGLAIPPGTILPVHLNSAISSSKSKAGQIITGRIMQDVPLPAGLKIRAGSKIIGHVVEMTPASAVSRARISLQFDQLVSSNQRFSITTNLRAIAGFMEVADAQAPYGAGESNDNQWLTTVQVGGDVAYGEGGPVTSGEDASIVVGKLVKGSLLGQVRAREGTKCRGAIYGNDSPQALWVFSSDACGTYGLEHIKIEHAGRTDPAGVIVLVSDHGNLRIASGAGMLLRVNASSRN
jgi:hypothetical protein